MIFHYQDGDFKPINVTMFPDGTSQVWHNNIVSDSEIWWMFENEAEVMHIIQLCDRGLERVYVPFLPYARQDKDWNPESDDQAYALFSFMTAFQAFETKFVSLDRHSMEDTYVPNRNFSFDVFPYDFIQAALEGIDVIIFPDEGARNRYNTANLELGERSIVVMEKVRDVDTGKVRNYNFKQGYDQHLIKDARCLMIDDICDGGATFIRCADVINFATKPASLDLYVTHGIFSRGQEILHNAGIRNILCANDHLFRRNNGQDVRPSMLLRECMVGAVVEKENALANKTVEYVPPMWIDQTEAVDPQPIPVPNLVPRLNLRRAPRTTTYDNLITNAAPPDMFYYEMVNEPQPNGEWADIDDVVYEDDGEMPF